MEPISVQRRDGVQGRGNAGGELTEKKVRFAQMVKARGSLESEELDVAEDIFSVWRGTMAHGCR